MTSSTVLAGLLAGLGIILIVLAWNNANKRLLARVLGGSATRTVASPHKTLRWLSPLWEKMGSTANSVEDRLEAIQSKTSLESFRLQQILAGFVGTILMTSLGISLTIARPLSVLQWVLIAIIGFIVGALAFDKMLSWRVQVLSRRISTQVADAAQLLALSVSAGESIPAALRRVCHVVGPELGTQLAKTLEQIENGSSVTRALTRLRDLTRSPQLARLLDTLISAMDRGAPLATTLREQARDLTDETRRELMESGGRREVLMLFPVVFIILPVTILFALYPGLIALRL